MPHKDHLMALRAICLLIFRHISQKPLARHGVCLWNLGTICRKIRLRILCSVAIKRCSEYNSIGAEYTQMWFSISQLHQIYKRFSIFFYK